MNKISKNTYITAGIALVLILAAIYFLFIFQKKPKEIKSDLEATEIKKLEEIPFEKRPFVTLTPTSDGAEIIISMENMSEFDKAEYELTYLADNPEVPGEKIERGTTGTDVNTKEAKYKKSLLLGTASRGVRNPDKGITDGKLTLHLFKGDVEFQNESRWVRLEAGAKAQTIKDPSEKFAIDLPNLGKDYWIILADTVGMPKTDGTVDIQNVIKPVYGSFAVAEKFPRSAKVTINLEEGPEQANIYAFDLLSEKWEKLQSTLDSTNKSISANTNTFQTFAVVK